METQLQAESSIRIHAPRNKVWEAIIRPEIVKRYFYEANLRADWRKGGEIVYSGFWDGKAYEDRGTILDYEEGFAVTMDFPGKYGKVTYALIDQSDPNILNISTHEYSTVVNVTQSGVETEEQRKAAEKSWNEVLHKMKELLEG